ncbi:MAG: hypothetical protein GY847_41970 [Proteobacteria bacterium]|nr:hypothetical protein [Pseudomonadota bacterium]
MQRQSKLSIGKISRETEIGEIKLTRILNEHGIPYNDLGDVLVRDLILALAKMPASSGSTSSRNSGLKFDLIKRIELETEYKFLDNAQTRSALCTFQSKSWPEKQLNILIYVCGGMNRFNQVSFRICHLNRDDIDFVALIAVPFKGEFLYTPDEIKEIKKPDSEGRVTVSFKTRISEEFEFENSIRRLKTAL